MSKRIEVVITGDADSLSRAFGQAQKSGSKFGSAVSKASKVAAGALVGLGVAAKLGFDELMEAEQVGAQTEAVLKSTGGAANATKKEIEALAGALSAKSGVDDEAIQSGQNMLLTFTKIRNEVGKGNDVFNQATKATLDMSVAMGKDMSSSAILVGKALNDPIKGMSALSKAGIQFTAAQKEQVKAMVEAGDTMGAQKMILKELETQFGGSAAAAGNTFAGQINKLKNSLAETAAELVSALLPAVQSLASKLQVATNWAREHQGVVKTVTVAIVGLSLGVLALNVGLKAYAVAQALVRGATVAWTAAQWLLNAALAANPVSLVILAIAGLAAGLAIAWTKSQTFRTVVTGVFNAVRDTVLSAVSLILLGVSKFLGGLASIMEAASKIPGVGGKFRGLAEDVRGAQARVDGLRDSINSLQSKAITVSINYQINRPPDAPGIGGRAHGGPVTKGQPYIVGERRPELFVPNENGTIIPKVPPMMAGGRRGGGGDGGGQRTININLTGHSKPMDEAEVGRQVQKALVNMELLGVGTRWAV